MGAKSHKTNIWNPCIAIGFLMFSFGKQDYTTESFVVAFLAKKSFLVATEIGL
jgi:hypothetical protein